MEEAVQHPTGLQHTNASNPNRLAASTEQQAGLCATGKHPLATASSLHIQGLAMPRLPCCGSLSGTPLPSERGVAPSCMPAAPNSGSQQQVKTALNGLLLLREHC